MTVSTAAPEADLAATRQPLVWRIVRALVIVGGFVTLAAGLLAFRSADLWLYVVYVVVGVIVALPPVELLPRLRMPIPTLATTVGFLYLGGLPIIVLSQTVLPSLLVGLRLAVPRRWADRLPQLREGSVPLRAHLLPASIGLDRRFDLASLAEFGMYSLGLGVRWWLASAISAGTPPASEAIALGEVCGYLTWATLSFLPLYPDRGIYALASTVDDTRRTAHADLGLIVVLVLTPWVFLITYSYRIDGIVAASAYAVMAIGMHFVLDRLNERRKLLEEQNVRLAALNRELEHRERLSAIGKMSSVVSHQILQQLGVIGIYADLVRNAGDGGDPAAALREVRAHGAAIEAALGDVNRVLTDLLVFSRDLRLNLYEQPLCRLLDECVGECASDAARRGIRLRSVCPAELAVALDKLKMRQAICNVLRNALEESPPDGDVLLEARADAGEVEIAVTDAGKGVPEEAREAIFTPFYTTKEHGTGLGLAIAREFAVAHGGRLWVEGGAGGGSCFVFRLPRVAAKAAEASAGGPPRFPRAGATSGGDSQ
jgi:signal transduction histidine kinase